MFKRLKKENMETEYIPTIKTPTIKRSLRLFKIFNIHDFVDMYDVKQPARYFHIKFKLYGHFKKNYKDDYCLVRADLFMKCTCLYTLTLEENYHTRKKYIICHNMSSIFVRRSVFNKIKTKEEFDRLTNFVIQKFHRHTK